MGRSLQVWLFGFEVCGKGRVGPKTWQKAHFSGSSGAVPEVFGPIDPSTCKIQVESAEKGDSRGAPFSIKLSRDVVLQRFEESVSRGGVFSLLKRL
eukprot:3052330-Amphidinium_carterae.2